MKLIHLTDPHLVPPGELLYDLDPRERFTEAIEDINRSHADAELCIISGDLAHRADPAAYEVLESCLDSLEVPCCFVMGNHDDRSKLLTQFPMLPKDKHGFIQYRMETTAGNMFFLDTVEPGTHAGVYCERRRAWLKQQLSEHRDQHAYLVSHHPPFDVGIPAMDAIGMRQDDAFALGEMLAEFDHVKHLFFGHLHRPLSGTWRGIGFNTLRATNHQVWLDFQACDSIPGSFEPPAYAVALIKSDQIVIHTHDFLDNSTKFQLGSWRWEEWYAEEVLERAEVG